MDYGVGGSFQVHLQSLNDFAQRLAEQLEVVQRSAQTAAVFNQPPDLPLGAFAEAFSVGEDHADEVTGVAGLMAKIAQSIDFARSVTTLVAQRYAALDSGGAQSIGSVVGGLPATPAPFGTAATGFPLPTVYGLPVNSGYPTAQPAQPSYPAQPGQTATGTATPPPGSLAPPDVVAQFDVPIPPDGGTVYYFNGTTSVPVTVTVEAQ